MTVIDSHNDGLSQIMKKATLEMPFSDFEEIVMLRISKETIYKNVLSRDRKFSFIFFVLGTGLGLIINSILQKTRYSFLDSPPDITLLIFQAGFVLIFLVQLENNLHLIEKRKKQKLQT